MSTPLWSESPFGVIHKAWTEKQHPRNSRGMFTHAQAELTTPHGDKVEVDRGLQHTIAGLWTHGVGTFYSCQGSKREDAIDYGDDPIHNGHSGYIYMLDNGRWQKLQKHWSEHKDEYSPELQGLITRMEQASVARDHFHKNGLDHTWTLKRKGKSKWLVELDERDHSKTGYKTMTVRFPHTESKLLEKLMQQTRPGDVFSKSLKPQHLQALERVVRQTHPDGIVMDLPATGAKAIQRMSPAKKQLGYAEGRLITHGQQYMYRGGKPPNRHFGAKKKNARVTTYSATTSDYQRRNRMLP